MARRREDAEHCKEVEKTGELKPILQKNSLLFYLFVYLQEIAKGKVYFWL